MIYDTAHNQKVISVGLCDVRDVPTFRVVKTATYNTCYALRPCLGQKQVWYRFSVSSTNGGPDPIYSVIGNVDGHASGVTILVCRCTGGTVLSVIKLIGLAWILSHVRPLV